MTSSSPAETLATVVGWIFGGFFAFVGLMFTAFGGFQIYQGQSTQDWPAVSGEILSSEIKSRTTRSSGRKNRSPRRKTKYSVKVQYAYDVEGQSHTGDRIQYGYQSHEERSGAQAEIKQYPKGKAVDVFYDPEKPVHSVLIKGTGSSWIWLVVGSVILLIGLAVMIYMVRSRKKGRGNRGR